MRIGLYGGGFDPVHPGHILVAQTVKPYVDQVWLMPCYGHVFGKQPISPTHRLEMCRLATQGLPNILVNDFEIAVQSDGVAYHTLQDIAKKYGHDFQFVIGQDNADHMDKWRFADRLLSEFSFIVLSCGTPGLDWYRRPPHIFIETPITSKRSTHIRDMLYEQNNEVRSHLAPVVFDYIREHGLYGWAK